MAWLALRCRQLLTARRGQSMTEYALIVGLIAILLIAGLAATRVSYQGVFSNLGSALNVDNTTAATIPPPPPGWTWWQWWLWWLFHH